MPASRGFIKEILEKYSFTILAETDNVQSTVNKYAEFHPDIIIVNSSPTSLYSNTKNER